MPEVTHNQELLKNLLAKQVEAEPECTGRHLYPRSSQLEWDGSLGPDEHLAIVRMGFVLDAYQVSLVVDIESLQSHRRYRSWKELLEDATKHRSFKERLEVLLSNLQGTPWRHPDRRTVDSCPQCTHQSEELVVYRRVLTR